MKIKQLFTLDTLETAIRIWTAFFIFIYGMAKSMQFKGAKLLDIPIKDASKSEMMWAFFGTTQEYPIIIGCLQIIGAILLVFNRTKLLAALLLTPIFINIILLDIFYKIAPGALLNAVIYQSVFIFIFIQQRKRISEMFNILSIKSKAAISVDVSIVKYLIATVLAAILFFLFQYFSGQIS